MQEIGGVHLNNSLGLKVVDYVHPNEVVRDDRLSEMDKRTLLCAWASDACAVESKPGFRWLPGTPGPILLDHVFKALCTLDDLARRSRYAVYDAVPTSQLFRSTAEPSGIEGRIAR